VSLRHLYLHASAPLDGVKNSGVGFGYGTEGMKEWT